MDHFINCQRLVTRRALLEAIPRLSVASETENISCRRGDWQYLPQSIARQVISNAGRGRDGRAIIGNRQAGSSSNTATGFESARSQSGFEKLEAALQIILPNSVCSTANGLTFSGKWYHNESDDQRAPLRDHIPVMPRRQRRKEEFRLAVGTPLSQPDHTDAELASQAGGAQRSAAPKADRDPRRWRPRH